MAGAKKELAEIVKAAEGQGWQVKTNKRGHPMFFASHGRDGEQPMNDSIYQAWHRKLGRAEYRLRITMAGYGDDEDLSSAESAEQKGDTFRTKCFSRCRAHRRPH